MLTQKVQTPKWAKPLYEPHRYKVYWGGRGSGKSTAFADAIIARMYQEPTRVLCTREKQNSIKESVHALLAKRIADGGYEGFEVTNTEIRHQNGSKAFFMGLWNNIDSIKSVDGVQICWIEEANTVSEGSWAKLIPTIRAPGSEIWVSFNPELKTDAAYQRFVLRPSPDAFVKKVSWRDNPWFTAEMRSEMDHLKAMDHEDYLHVWEGELKTFADGAIYQKELRKARSEGRICSVPIEPSAEVHTAWDLGRNDATAIWFFQEVGREIRVIDYLEGSLTGLDYYIRELKKRDYNYGIHYLPHDAGNRELSTNKSRTDYLKEGGLRNIKVVPRIPSINDGIEQTRQFFPRCWFDEKRCERGIDALANYQFTFNETNNAFGLTPLHNWASNGADAFRQAAQGYKPRRSIDTSEYAVDPKVFE